MSELLISIDLYEVRLRKDHRGVDLISDALPFGRLCFPDNCTQSRTAAWDRTIVRLSLCPLLNPVESEGA
jgi:hypothetical protein